jgi:hypothetical protein
VSKWWAGAIAISVFVLVVLFVGLLLAGDSFWRTHPSLAWNECMFGKADCSGAAGTWFLTFVGLLAFIVGALTVFYASRALGIETASRLGQAVCSHHNHDAHPADKCYFLTDSGDVLDELPLGLKEADIADQYTAKHNAFVNLGRTALPVVTVKMHAYGKEKDQDWYIPRIIPIGNVRCEPEVHVTVYAPKSFGSWAVAWSGARMDGQRIEFYPETPFTDPFFELEWSRPLEPLQLGFNVLQPFTRSGRARLRERYERVRVEERHTTDAAAGAEERRTASAAAKNSPEEGAGAEERRTAPAAAKNWPEEGVGAEARGTAPAAAKNSREEGVGAEERGTAPAAAKNSPEEAVGAEARGTAPAAAENSPPEQAVRAGGRHTAPTNSPPEEGVHAVEHRTPAAVPRNLPPEEGRAGVRRAAPAAKRNAPLEEDLG